MRNVRFIKKKRHDKMKDPREPSPSKILLFWLLVIAGTAADLWTKSTIHDWLSTLPNKEYSIVDGLAKFVIHLNPGAICSILKDYPLVLILISIMALFAVVGLFLLGKIHGRLMTVALACFTAGILGNLHDRTFNDGFVRDFIDVYWRGHHWPTFNIADSLLCIAVGLIIIHSFISSSSQKPAHIPT